MLTLELELLGLELELLFRAAPTPLPEPLPVPLPEPLPDLASLPSSDGSPAALEACGTATTVAAAIGVEACSFTVVSIGYRSAKTRAAFLFETQKCRGVDEGIGAASKSSVVTAEFALLAKIAAQPPDGRME